MAPVSARTMPQWLGCLLAATIVTASASAAAAVSKEHDPQPAGMPSTLHTMPALATTGAKFGARNGTDGAPTIYTQDQFLDEATRQSLIAYLDTTLPTNNLDIVMVPTPTSLFRKFHATLDGLGRRSSSTSRFPGFQTKDYQSGEGRFPGKLSLAGDKQCHIDYEVDTDFEVDNIMGPTDGRVGILYLAGEGEFVVVDDATKEEHRVEITPGRFISWDNKAHKHCVLTSSGEPRRFLGPVVLDADGTGLIPVVDIVTPNPDSCPAAGDCSGNANSCVASLCCTAPGSVSTTADYCCPGSTYNQGKCCFLAGTSSSSAAACCSQTLVDGICAVSGGPFARLYQCKSAVQREHKNDQAKCRQTAAGASRKACLQRAASVKSTGTAYCYSIQY